MKALLALEDGRTFTCRSFTGPGETGGEVVFNTSMTGYQEILTDPSYRGQMVAMTYPLMGNYGVNSQDVESGRIQVSAFIVREYQPFPSNHRSEGTLAEYLSRNEILGVEELDTRALTRHIRKAGSMRAVISTMDLDPESLVRKARALKGMEGCNLANEVSTKRPYRWAGDAPEYIDAGLDETVWRHRNERHSVAVFDFGIKYNIIRLLENSGCEVIVLPASTNAETVRKLNPQGIFLSNGPGDPEPVTGAISTVKELLGYRPMFGICLGHQILCLALGGRSFKLKFGHRGGNQPVKNIQGENVEITSQNHGFAVDMDSMKNKDVEITHINLNDNTVEGFRHKTMPVFAVQYHPEAAPGPNDAAYLFESFTRMMKDSV